MNAKWNEAARKYEDAEAARARQQQERTISATRDSALKDEERRQQQRDIDRGTSELEQFMRTEGRAAMELLRASKRHLIFGEENGGGGCGTVQYIDGNGLQQSVEAMGSWGVYAKEVPKPKLSSITARQAVEAAVYRGGKRGTEVVSWLRDALDSIASAAPKNE